MLRSNGRGSSLSLAVLKKNDAEVQNYQQHTNLADMKTQYENVSMCSKRSRTSDDLRLLVARKLRREQKFHGDAYGGGRKSAQNVEKALALVRERLLCRLRFFF